MLAKCKKSIATKKQSNKSCLLALMNNKNKK